MVSQPGKISGRSPCTPYENLVTSFDPARIQPTRQPEAIAARFEGKRNPRDLFTGPDRLIAPAMQQAKQPFGTRLQFLARLTLNAGKHTGEARWLLRTEGRRRPGPVAVHPAAMHRSRASQSNA
jgi:hypothetical protein